MIGAIPIVAENRIREAMELGEFENLAGAGRPLLNPGGNDAPDWWVKRKIEGEGLNAVDVALRAKEPRP